MLQFCEVSWKSGRLRTRLPRLRLCQATASYAFCCNARHTGLCPGKVCDAQSLPKTIWHCASSYRLVGRTVNKATFELLKLQLDAKCQACQIPCVRNLKTHFGSMYHDRQENRCSNFPILRQLKMLSGIYSQSDQTDT